MLNALVQIIQVALDHVLCELSAVIWEGRCARERERDRLSLSLQTTLVAMPTCMPTSESRNMLPPIYNLANKSRRLLLRNPLLLDTVNAY
jgi:hypothetical protein